MALAWPFPAPRRRPSGRPAASIPDPAVAPLPAPLWGELRGALLGIAARLPWRDLAAQALLGLAAALLLGRALVEGTVRWEADTRYFYYPLLSTVAAALKEGRLPIWEPGVFGGYPLFADGEAGMLYPPHLLALRFLPPPAALVALRLARFYLAGAFTYAFLRATGAGRTGSLVAGLGFMLSGFLVAQVVHENLDGGMIWLPLALCFVERALRVSGPRPAGRRATLAAFAGVALAMQALAVHVQVCVFTALTVFPYLAWRSLVPRPRLLTGLQIGAVMGLVGAGLAAVQLLPLLDLAARSARGPGIATAAATINSVTPFRLLTVLFPHLLSRPDGSNFGYWVSWEVTVYVGVPVLLLALLAVALRHDRYVTFFALLTPAALLLSTGRYGPEWVVLVTEHLLGAHGLRSPGRFAFLWSFGAAVLAGYGADWLDRQGGRGSGRVARAWQCAVCVLLGAGAAGLLLVVREGRRWLLAEPAAARAWLERHYLAFDPSVGLKVGAEEVRQHLLAALDPRAPQTVAWGLGVVAGCALLVLWALPAVGRRAGDGGRGGGSQASALDGGRGSSGARAPAGRSGLRRAARLLTLAAVALPLLGAAQQAHPAAPLSAIEPRSGAVEFLKGQLASAGTAPAARPLARVYTSQPVYLDHFDVEPNALLPLGLQEAGGYSSLSTRASLAYAWAAETSQGRLLDVWNVRYFVWPSRPDQLPSHELTSFHPQRPLASGTGTNAGAAASFRVPGVTAENVRVVATLRDAWGVPEGAVVAWVVATDDLGQRQRWPLRMGQEIADATAPPPPSPTGAASGPRPQAVFSWKEPGPGGRLGEARLYYVKLPLDHPRTIVRLTVRPVPVPASEQPIFRLYGLGVGRPDWWVHCVDWFDRERFTPVYRDEQVRIFRNERALPRAYLAPLAVTLPAEQHLKAMAERGFDPERMLLLDPGAPGGLGAPGAPAPGLEGPSEAVHAGGWLGPPPDPADAGDPAPEEAAGGVRQEDDLGRVARSRAGRAAVTRYDPHLVEVEVEASAPAWLFLADTFDPGWSATVDGQARPIRLANAMFRAVAVPAGRHVVAFRYTPAPLAWGATVTLATGVIVLLVAGVGLAGAVRTGAVRACRPRRTDPPGAPSDRP